MSKLLIPVELTQFFLYPIFSLLGDGLRSHLRFQTNQTKKSLTTRIEFFSIKANMVYIIYTVL